MTSATRLLLAWSLSIIAAGPLTAQGDAVSLAQATSEKLVHVHVAPRDEAAQGDSEVLLVMENRTNDVLRISLDESFVLLPETVGPAPVWTVPTSETLTLAPRETRKPAIEWLRLDLEARRLDATVPYQAKPIALWRDDPALVRLGELFAQMPVSHHVAQLAVWQLYHQRPLHELRSLGRANLAELYLAESLIETARDPARNVAPPFRLALEVTNAAGPGYEQLARRSKELAGRSHLLGLPVTLTPADKLLAERASDLTLTIGCELTIVRSATGLTARITLRAHEGGRFESWHGYETALPADVEPAALLDLVEVGILNRLVRVEALPDGAARLENDFRFAIDRLEVEPKPAMGEAAEALPESVTLDRLRLGPGRRMTWPLAVGQKRQEWLVRRVAWGY
jgi:hypothetical protein